MRTLDLFNSLTRDTVFPTAGRFRSLKNVADAKLENTSLSTDVFQGLLLGNSVSLAPKVT